MSLASSATVDGPTAIRAGWSWPELRRWIAATSRAGAKSSKLVHADVPAPGFDVRDHVRGDAGTAELRAALRNVRPIWTVDSVKQLGMTTDAETAAAVLGISRILAYDLVRTNEFPVRLIRLGRRVVVPVPDLLKLLGAD